MMVKHISGMALIILSATPGHVANAVSGALSVPKTDRNTTFAGDAMRLAGIFGRSKRKFGAVATVGKRAACRAVRNVDFSMGVPHLGRLWSASPPECMFGAFFGFCESGPEQMVVKELDSGCV